MSNILVVVNFDCQSADAANRVYFINIVYVVDGRLIERCDRTIKYDVVIIDLEILLDTFLLFGF